MYSNVYHILSTLYDVFNLLYFSSFYLLLCYIQLYSWDILPR
nr:MAG TPA: hypothetical protein [Caudoviricetes sp.]